jgi:hypothetical protein
MKLSNSLFLDKLDYHVDIEELKLLLTEVEWDNDNRSRLNEPLGNWLYDSYQICDKWKGTAFEKILNDFPFPIGEARLMKLPPQGSYRSHADVDDRYHLNIIGNEHCYLIDLESTIMHPLVSDGYFYKMDGGRIHTAVNFGSTDRVQLVIRVPLEKNLRNDFVSHTFSILNPPIDLRYRFDQKISPIINREIKKGEIGYFDMISPTKIKMILSNTVLKEIQLAFGSINIEVSLDD